MANDRASIFDDDQDNLDLSGFEPKQRIPDKPAVSPEKVRAVAEANHFPSRSPAPPTPVASPRRVYRTGRNIQLNVKATQATIDKFYRIAEEHGWVLGETLERAVEALDKSFRPGTEEGRGEREEEAAFRGPG